MQILWPLGIASLAFLGFFTMTYGFSTFIDDIQQEQRLNRQFKEYIIKNGSKFSTKEEALKAFKEKKAKEAYEQFLKDNAQKS